MWKKRYKINTPNKKVKKIFFGCFLGKQTMVEAEIRVNLQFKKRQHYGRSHTAAPSRIREIRIRYC